MKPTGRKKDGADQASSEVDGLGFDLPDDVWMSLVRESAAPAALGRIGGYEIIQEISRGGQGIVYRARQPKTKRDVALKRIIAGTLAGADERIRFEREIEAAAALNHPNIVTVYGMEVVEDLPLLAMEWIDGQPVDRWARGHGESRPGVTERVRLFAKICDAIRHAHQRGVIHRDLKPSNILVDSAGQPHVLDFGLAKLIVGDQADRTLTRGFVGTPVYASPEQLRAERDLDVRSDVYSLGVILYQILTESLPHSPERNLPDLLQDIQYVDPKKPSSVVIGLDSGLDAIVLKALRKDRADRYLSVDTLAADVERYLAGEPVEAHPPSTAYQLRKFVGRNRALVAASAAMFVVLVAATAISVTYGLREARQRILLDEQLVETKRQAAIAQAVNSFLNEDVLAAADPLHGMDPNESIRTVLDQASSRIEGRFTEEPAVEASIRVVLAQAYINLGEHAVAETHILAAISLLESESNPDDPRNLNAHRVLAKLRSEQGRYGEAEDIYRRQLAIAERVLGSDADETLAIVNGLGVTQWQQGKYDEAIALARRAVDGHRQQLGRDHPDTIRAMTGLTVVLTDAAQLDDAESVAREAHEASLRTFGETHVTVSTCLDNLGRVLLSQSKPGDAVPLFERSLTISEELLGSEHPHTLITMTNLATGFQQMQRWSEAEELLVRSVDIKKRTLGPVHPSTLVGMQTLADQYRKLGQLEDAARINRQVVKGRQETLGENHPATLTSMNNLAGIQYAQGDHVGAVETLRDIYVRMREALGPDHPKTITVLNNIAGLQMVRGNYNEAESAFRDVLSSFRKVTGESSPEVGRTLNNLAEVLRRRGDPAAAEPLHREGLAVRRAALGDEHPAVATSMHNLALTLNELGDHEAAADMHEQALDLRRRKLGEDHPHVASSLGGLAHAKYKSGDLDAAAESYQEALEIRSVKLGSDHPITASTMLGLARVLADLDKTNEALALARDARAIQARSLPSNHPAHLVTAALLAQMLIATGEYEEAESRLDEVVKTLRPDLPMDVEQKAKILEVYSQLYAPSALDKPDELVKVTELLASTTATDQPTQREEHP